MEKTLTALMVAFTLLVTSGGVGYAQDFDKGDAAYRSGDYATALREFRPLAERGNAKAQGFLGFMYGNGQGVTQNHKEATKWYRKAAEQGDAFAQLSLGVMYQYVAQDYKQAVKWYRKSAEQGNAQAQYNLGYRYHIGQGVTHDNKEAWKWFRKSAEQGYAKAQAMLGVMYQYVAEDAKEAVNWYRKSAEQGHAEAQGLLGQMYAKGQGVVQDNVYAHMWLSIAASMGDALTINSRDNVAKKMTPSQLAEAQKLARECVRKNYKGC